MGGGGKGPSRGRRRWRCLRRCPRCRRRSPGGRGSPPLRPPSSPPSQIGVLSHLFLPLLPSSFFSQRGSRQPCLCCACLPLPLPLPPPLHRTAKAKSFATAGERRMRRRRRRREKRRRRRRQRRRRRLRPRERERGGGRQTTTAASSSFSVVAVAFLSSLLMPNLAHTLHREKEAWKEEERERERATTLEWPPVASPLVLPDYLTAGCQVKRGKTPTVNDVLRGRRIILRRTLLNVFFCLTYSSLLSVNAIWQHCPLSSLLPSFLPPSLLLLT